MLPYSVSAYYALIYTRSAVWIAIWLVALALLGRGAHPAWQYAVACVCALVATLFTWIVAGMYDPSYRFYAFMDQWTRDARTVNGLMRLLVSIVFQLLVWISFLPYDHARPEYMLLSMVFFVFVVLMAFLYDKHSFHDYRIVPSTSSGEVAARWHRHTSFVVCVAVLIDVSVRQARAANLWLMGALLFYTCTRFWSAARLYRWLTVSNEHALARWWFARLSVNDAHNIHGAHGRRGRMHRTECASYLQDKLQSLWTTGGAS